MTTPAIVPGAVRIRAMAADGSVFASPMDCAVETQQADGSWIDLRGVYAPTVSIMPGELVHAELRVEIREFAMVAAPGAVSRAVVCPGCKSKLAADGGAE